MQFHAAEETSSESSLESVIARTYLVATSYAHTLCIMHFILLIKRFARLLISGDDDRIIDFLV